MQEWMNVESSEVYVMVRREDFVELKETLKELVDNLYNDGDSLAKAESRALELVARYYP